MNASHFSLDNSYVFYFFVGDLTLPILGGLTLRNFGGSKLLITNEHNDFDEMYKDKMEAFRLNVGKVNYNNPNPYIIIYSIEE